MDRKIYLSPVPLDGLFLDDRSLEFFSQIVTEAEGDIATSKERMVPRDREAGHKTLMDDYFGDDKKYDDKTFQSQFRLPKTLILKIGGDIERTDAWFQEGYDRIWKKSFTALQKCASALKQLGTGNPPDEFDEYLCMSAKTSHECLDYFCEDIINLDCKEFLRRPTSHDIALLYQTHEVKHHLPVMLGSIDCTHFVWRMCPTKYGGQYMRGDHQYPTITYEVVASQDMWFWHAYCGTPGSNNDINVLQQSPLYLTEQNGTAPKCPFHLNGREYKHGYYLTDGIYPTWATFVKATPFLADPKEKRFEKVQESARKDVKRAFGILKSKWGILRRHFRAMSVDKIRRQVYACMILHNMILKEDGNAISPVYIRDPPVEPFVDENIDRELQDSNTHYWLRYDLTEHLATLGEDEDEE